MSDRTFDAALQQRFGEAVPLDIDGLEDTARALFEGQFARRSRRWFTDRPVPEDLLRLVAAFGLSAPSKSDLQQRDIIWVRDAEVASEIKALVSDQTWVAQAPHLFVFCGNNARQRAMHEIWDRPFANDHLDAFFNAGVDAGIALSATMIGAEALGLGCCPISALRNDSDAVRRILKLPDHVFPVAGLAIGWPDPERTPPVSPRLPLSATLHTDCYGAPDDPALFAAYDACRTKAGFRGRPRAPETFGAVDTYVWSDDKTRQYAQPERDSFGRFIKSIGFRLD